jgi:hypothetical protein
MAQEVRYDGPWVPAFAGKDKWDIFRIRTVDPDFSHAFAVWRSLRYEP